MNKMTWDVVPLDKLTDPSRFCKFMWPAFTFADYQLEIMESVDSNVETYVPAANKMGAVPPLAW